MRSLIPMASDSSQLTSLYPWAELFLKTGKIGPGSGLSNDLIVHSGVGTLFPKIPLSVSVPHYAYFLVTLPTPGPNGSLVPGKKL